jgi:hypothetical protein
MRVMQKILVYGVSDCGIASDWQSRDEPGLQDKQLKVDQILAYIKNHEKEGKTMKQVLKTDKPEISEMRKEHISLGPNLTS